MVKQKKEIQTLGHQVKVEVKALGACKSDLESAYAHIQKISGPHAIQIAGLIMEVAALQIAAEDAVNQND